MHFQGSSPEEGCVSVPVLQGVYDGSELRVWN